MLLETRDRDEYLSGQVVYYFDHDIPIKNAAQFLNEIENLQNLAKLRLFSK